MTLTNIQSTAQQMAETASTVSADRHTGYVPKPITGQQYSISSGPYSATIAELGAGLRTLTFEGHDIVVSYDPNKTVPCCNGYVLVPFPNRLEDGEYCFEGTDHALPIDERERQTALHGLGYRYMWELKSLADTSVTLSWRVPAILGYPFDVVVTVTYSLGSEGLSMTCSAENLGSHAAPWAFGIHPWLSNGRAGYGNDEIEADNALCSLRLPGNTHVIASKDRLLPQGEESVEGTPYDLRNTTSLTGKVFDDAWTDLDRAEDGSSTAIFTRSDGIAVHLKGDATVNAWQVCTGTGFPADAHPAGVAVEPMTAYANAFRTGRNLVTIQPGERYSTTISYHIERV
ncbi:aldose epimerase [Bifidobacterium aquikefiri]|uniref:Aldose epimerase n=2 Tax=Bifidobacterium aquikefiri TaxID=1653207 RepID=A0A261G1N6_9BIFI|nr:aldose epimerase [Bifidobacterium aquikefiri]